MEQESRFSKKWNENNRSVNHNVSDEVVGLCLNIQTKALEQSLTNYTLVFECKGSGSDHMA